MDTLEGFALPSSLYDYTPDQPQTEYHHRLIGIDIHDETCGSLNLIGQWSLRIAWVTVLRVVASVALSNGYDNVGLNQLTVNSMKYVRGRDLAKPMVILFWLLVITSHIFSPSDIITMYYWCLNQIGDSKKDNVQHQNPHGRRRQHRDDLTGEHRLGDLGQISLAFLFFAVWISDSFFLNYSTFLNQFVPPIVRIPIGIILLILSGFLALKSLAIVFRDKTEKPTVIKKSVFNIVRHPMYLSEILLYFGLLMLSISLAATFIWVAAIAFLHYISRYEEKLLVKRFGEEYRQYMREVPMWIPRIGRR